MLHLTRRQDAIVDRFRRAARRAPSEPCVLLDGDHLIRDAIASGVVLDRCDRAQPLDVRRRQDALLAADDDAGRAPRRDRGERLVVETGVVDDEQRVARSEEHTSELQSH